ncbi:MAG: biliverdin-producing heme oxygenase [Gordonia sp. (in: high G+C Gram-positive bacteria)]
MTITPLDPTGLADVTLSTAMREGSAAEHDQAEHTTFMEELLGGKLNEAAYADYLRRLRVVYATLESVGRQLTDDPIAGPLLDPALERLSAIDADLTFWAPGEPFDVASDAASAYASRIAASAAWGGLFLAHHYTRYLGDLSGGQVVGRLLGRHFDLDGRGVAFYDFPEIGKTKPYKDAYRAELDAVGSALSPDDRARIVTEVKAAFRANQDLFNELGSDLSRYRR